MKPDPKHFTVTREYPFPQADDVSLTPEIELLFSTKTSPETIKAEGNIVLKDSDNNKDLSDWVNLQKGEVGHRTLDYYFFDFDNMTKTADDFEKNINVLLNHYQVVLNHKKQFAVCLDRAINHGVPGPLDEQLINLSPHLNQILLDQAGCAY